MANRVKMMGLALGFCFVGAITAWGYPAGSAIPEIPSQQGDGTRRFALLIGIDKYRSSTIPRLEGCKNDVRAMKSVLIGRYRFPEKNVHVLLDEQATYTNIVNEIKSFLVANATRPGDIVVIHYSGHGSRSPDPKAPSGTEETIVPYDSRDQKNLDITAKAFSSMLKVLAQKTKNITVILDSCNSGRIVKTRGVVTTKVRSIAEAKSAPLEPPSWTDGVRGMDDGQSKLSPLDDSYVLLAAALAKENAKEYSIGSQHYGVFSYFLTRALQTAPPDASYRDVMGPVKLQVIDSVDDETPQIVGPNQDHQLFGASVKDAIPYLLVMPDSESGKVKLPYAGEPHGITPGSIYDVYSSNVEKFESPAKPIAQIEIEQVNPDFSTGKVVAGGTVPDYSRAILRELHLSNRKLRIWIQQTPHSKALDSIASLIKGFPQVSLVENPQAGNLLVYEDKDQVVLGTPDGIPLSVPRPVREGISPPADSSLALDIGQQILKWANWFYILSLESRDSGLDVELSVTSEDTSNKGRDPEPELARIGRADNVFLAGEKAIVTIKNKSSKTIYVTLLVISSDRTISVLLPDRAEQGAAVELQAGASISPRVPPRAFVPRCLSSTRDSFKVIATSKPVDLRILEQTKSVCDDSRPRSARDLSDLQNLLNSIIRGFGPETGAWTSARKVVEVQPRKTATN